MWILVIAERSENDEQEVCCLLIRIWDLKEVVYIEDYINNLLNSNDNLLEFMQVKNSCIYYHYLNSTSTSKQELCNQCVKELLESIESFLQEKVYIRECRTRSLYPSNVFFYISDEDLYINIEDNQMPSLVLASKMLELLSYRK